MNIQHCEVIKIILTDIKYSNYNIYLYNYITKVENKLPYKCSTSSLPSKSCPRQLMEEKTGGEGTCRLSQPVRGSSHGA